MTADPTKYITIEKNHSVHGFAGPNGDYYHKEFSKIESSSSTRFSFNTHAAFCGPFWAAARSVWGFFWLSALANLVALVHIGKGLWGELGAEELARAERLSVKSQEMAVKAQAAIDAGASNGEALQRSAANLQQAAENAIASANLAAQGATQFLLWGVIGLLLVMVVQGIMANPVYEKKYCRWRSDKGEKSGFCTRSLLFGAGLISFIYPLTIYRYTVQKPIDFLVSFPLDKSLYISVSNWLDWGFDQLAEKGAGFFGGITTAITVLLDTLEVVLVDTPWPVTSLVIVVMAWRLAGAKVAVFATAALAYLAFMGFWEKSMSTVALLGAAATLCVIIGVPLGVWCAKNRYARTATEPVLDFMQTMPAFVYLIPIIAFFGTGKPPGILATIIFGLPPVVRLTALGIRQVPESIIEGAIAFGCNKRKLLLDVEIPLALPSIMAGVNQTILMCLSMVVIASLIGAEGLGSDVLMALQYAAKGQGLLAGLAILLCAMVIDRIVQGRFKRKE
ncbi:ABC transporter permease [Zobellella maritima]|uniref:ABC transporter permease n=1 Tax=Zobellella maritima TaxID=2059725 RepID=UPI000E300F1E|nr:ABC transporter permease subunit [Zobellella maritima]